MAALMNWAQIASAKQMCVVAEMQINIASKSLSQTQSTTATDTDQDSENDFFFLRGLMEEEIHHDHGFFYVPTSRLVAVLSFPNHLHLCAQDFIFEQVKPPSFV